MRIVQIVLLSAALSSPTVVAAFDFGKLIEKVKDADVGKIIDVGKRMVTATLEMSEDQEIRLGQDLGGRLLGAMPPLPDAEVQAFVNRLGRWLSLQTERPDLPWHFAIVANDSLGAFATPGGNIFVTSALVSLMRDESELAGVLAHEIAHVIERHHVKAVMKKARAGLTRDLVADVAAEYTGGNPMVAQVLLDSGMNIYASGLDHEDEFAADEAGMLLAARAGYDPFGLLMLLTTLDALDPAEPRASLLFSTHPDTRARVERLANLAEHLEADYPNLLRAAERFEVMQSALTQ